MKTNQTIQAPVKQVVNNQVDYSKGSKEQLMALLVEKDQLINSQAKVISLSEKKLAKLSTDFEKISNMHESLEKLNYKGFAMPAQAANPVLDVIYSFTSPADFAEMIDKLMCDYAEFQEYSDDPEFSRYYYYIRQLRNAIKELPPQQPEASITIATPQSEGQSMYEKIGRLFFKQYNTVDALEYANESVTETVFLLNSNMIEGDNRTFNNHVLSHINTLRWAREFFMDVLKLDLEKEVYSKLGQECNK